MTLLLAGAAWLLTGDPIRGPADRRTDGFDIAQIGAEDGGSEQKAIFAQAGYAPADYFRINAMGRFQSNNAQIDSDTDSNDFVDDAAGFTNRRERSLAGITAGLDTFDKAWKHKVLANYLKDDFVSIDSAASLPFSNEGERHRLGYHTNRPNS